MNQHYLKLDTVWCIAVDTKLEIAEISERGHQKIGAKKRARRDSTLRLLCFLNSATSSFITAIESMREAANRDSNGWFAK